jgi:hypothetical protein
MAHPPRPDWPRLRTRLVLAAPDPDAAPRPVELPAAWDDAAAEALAGLAPGGGRASLTAAAEVWLRRLPPDLAALARDWLLRRIAAPDALAWGGGRDGVAINLAAFEEPGLGLDGRALREVGRAAVAMARALAPTAAPVLRLTDLDGMLANRGLDYGSAAAREAAVAVAAALHETGARLVGGPGRVDALLGAEAGGIAPRFDWLDPAGRLSRGARALLAARGLSAEAALAATLTGRSPLRLFVAVPAMPEAAAPTAAPTAPRRELPARPGGYAGRVTLGGHRVFVRTGEFADGGLAEVSLGLPKESAAVRALADSLGQVMSLALQHGTPLADLIELLVGTRFGPAGAVDGDPDVTRASSPLDYLARSLAAAYLPGLRLEPAEAAEAAPALPLDLPSQARPALRIVR